MRGWARRTLYGGGGAAGAVWRGAARPLARVWGAVAERRLAGAHPPARLPAPAVAVGNVTVGGGGKTSLVTWLLTEGLPPDTVAAVLSRGYGRDEKGVWVVEPGLAGRETARAAGDEPALLARHGAWVGVAADRALAARAVSARVRPDLFLLDDALQHRRVARSLDLVVFTADDLTAPARCLPAGPLREGPAWRPPVAAWVVTGADPRDRVWPAGSIGSAFGAWWEKLPGTPAEWEDDPAVTLAAWAAGAEEPFAAREPVIVFAGVARPESVAQAARRAGLDVEAVVAYPDHAAYRPGMVASLLASHPTGALVTTEKDAVKLDPAWFAGRAVGVLRRRLAPREPDLLRGMVRDAMGSDS